MPRKILCKDNYTHVDFGGNIFDIDDSDGFLRWLIDNDYETSYRVQLFENCQFDKIFDYLTPVTFYYESKIEPRQLKAKWVNTDKGVYKLQLGGWLYIKVNHGNVELMGHDNCNNRLVTVINKAVSLTLTFNKWQGKTAPWIMDEIDSMINDIINHHIDDLNLITEAS